MGFWGFVGSAGVILLLTLLILYEIFMRKPMQLTMEEPPPEAAPAAAVTAPGATELPARAQSSCPVLTEEEALLILRATAEAEAKDSEPAPEAPAAGQPEQLANSDGIFAQFTWMTCANEPEREVAEDTPAP